MPSAAAGQLTAPTADGFKPVSHTVLHIGEHSSVARILSSLHQTSAAAGLVVPSAAVGSFSLPVDGFKTSCNGICTTANISAAEGCLGYTAATGYSKNDNTTFEVAMVQEGSDNDPSTSASASKDAPAQLLIQRHSKQSYSC